MFGYRDKWINIIANDSYENFSSSLQNDFNEDRDVNEVTADVLIKTLRKAGVSKSQITPKLVDKLKEELISNKIIDSKNILNKNIDEMREALENIEFNWWSSSRVCRRDKRRVYQGNEW